MCMHQFIFCPIWCPNISHFQHLLWQTGLGYCMHKRKEVLKSESWKVSFQVFYSVIIQEIFLNKDTCNLKTFVIVHTALASWGVKHWFTHLYSFVFKVRLLLLWRVWLKNVDVVNHSFYKTVQIPMTFTISSKQSHFFFFKWYLAIEI